MHPMGDAANRGRTPCVPCILWPSGDPPARPVHPLAERRAIKAHADPRHKATIERASVNRKLICLSNEKAKYFLR